MIKYFFKLAFRNIKKYKVNTLISLLGLTVGLTSFILIASYISHELNFNKFNKNYDRIFLANINFQHSSKVEHGLNMPYPLLDKLIADFPEIKTGVRFSSIYNTLSNGEISFFENNASYVENSFFKVFSVNFLSGDETNALSDPYTIVLTKKFAEKYFGDEDPLGKDVMLAKKYSLKVTGVIDDLPVNSDFQEDFFISFKTFLAINSNRDFSQTWNNHQFLTVLLLDKNADYNQLNKKLAGFLDQFKDPVKRELYLTPLSQFHLKATDNDNSVKLLIILGIVAIFILIIACINFINLSIANATNRIKETSIRRIVGSKKSSLIFQQIGESVLLSFISFDFAFLLAERLLPNFNAILHSQIPSKIILNFIFIIGMFGVVLLLGVVSGIFPAIKIGRIQPLSILSGKESGINKAGIAKKSLIVFQYAVSIVLIIATIILSQQFKYIKEKDLGFDKDFVISCYVGKENNDINSNLKRFKEEMLRQAGVQNVALSRQLPFYGNSQVYIRKENTPENEVITTNYSITSLSYFETFDIDISLKKDFSINNSDSTMNYCYINQTAANKLGFKTAIGEIILMGGSKEKFEIVGVFDDYHVGAVSNVIPPQLIIPLGDEQTYDYYNWMLIKCNGHNLDKITDLADLKLKEYLPNNPYGFFNYGDSDFKAEALTKVSGIEKSFRFFTIIAIIIACMGIFGLVALTVKHKTKEIGIRKTLGSSVFTIYKLIAKEYLVLAILGNVLAWYPAWYFSNKILQDFAYRIDISLWVFVLGFISSILLTVITIAFHTIKAARTNPVEALRYE